MNKVVAVLVVTLGLVGLLVPSALAAKGDLPAPRMVAQECVEGEVCLTDVQTDFGGPSIDPSTVEDAPGNYTRSLIMIGIFAMLFVGYLRWALARGAKIG